MNLVLLISNHCKACIRAVDQLKGLQMNHPQINAEILHLHSYDDPRIFITPALIVDGELFSYGDIEVEKIIAKLK